MENHRKQLKALLPSKKDEINLLDKNSIKNFILQEISANDIIIDNEVFISSNGELRNLTEYCEKYKDLEQKPLSYIHILLLLKNNLLYKIVNIYN